MKIEELGLSDRVRNALRRNGIETVEQVLEMTPTEICGLRGIGAVGVNDILHCLERQKKKTP